MAYRPFRRMRPRAAGYRPASRSRYGMRRAAAPRGAFSPRPYGYRARGYSARSGYAPRRTYIGGRRY